MKNRKEISHEELQRAVNKFLKKGGTIEKLPEQRTSGEKMVGGRWMNTEMGGETGP